MSDHKGFLGAKWVLMNMVGELYYELMPFICFTFPRNTVHWGLSNKGQKPANVHHFLPNTECLKKILHHTETSLNLPLFLLSNSRHLIAGIIHKV